LYSPEAETWVRCLMTFNISLAAMAELKTFIPIKDYRGFLLLLCVLGNTYSLKYPQRKKENNITK